MRTPLYRLDPVSARPKLGLTAVCLGFVMALAAGPALAAQRPPASGAMPPDLLPGDARAASVSAREDSWIVGAIPGGTTRSIAGRHRAELLMDGTGLYRVALGRARGFAAALRRAGRYQFAEPDVLAQRQAFPADPLTQYQWGLPTIGVSDHDPPAVSGEPADRGDRRRHRPDASGYAGCRP
jgi:hypothetical protein